LEEKKKKKHVGFEVSMVVGMKMAVFWIVAPFQRTLLPPSSGRPDDGGSKVL
jgi:hypothetical protein